MGENGAAMDGTQAIQRRHERRAGVIRRALRREATRIREPKRMLAMGILIVAFALAIAGMTARGETAGADAQAYWAAVRIWLEGGDPYHPTGPFLPYVYAPWMLPLFIPWALLPWDVAWFVWRGGTILLLLWSIRWAYTQRPLATAVLVGLLAFPLAANLDTGNINLLLALALFGAHFTGPRVGGLIWGLATWMKWVPVLLWPTLPARSRAVGPRVPRGLGAAVARDAAAHDRPAPGAVRVRGAAAARRLPGVRLVGGAVVVAARATRSRSCGRRWWLGQARRFLAAAGRWTRSFRAAPAATAGVARTSLVSLGPRAPRAGRRSPGLGTERRPGLSRVSRRRIGRSQSGARNIALQATRVTASSARSRPIAATTAATRRPCRHRRAATSPLTARLAPNSAPTMS